MTRRLRAPRSAGMALVGTMLVLMVLLSLILVGTISQGTNDHFGAMTMTTNSITASGARTASVSAFNMAESGIDTTIAWLSSLPAPPVPPNYPNAAFAPATLWGSSPAGTPPRAVVIPNAADPTDYFSVEIYPDSSNPTNTQKKYLIESIGVSGSMTQIIRAYVEQTSLSKWLVLLNSWDPPNNYWVQGLSTFDGPVHDNVASGQTENLLWLNTPGTTPLFTYTGSDAYSVSGPSIAWWEDNYWTSAAPQTASDWANVAAGGANTVQTNVASVPFPQSSSVQEQAALGSAAMPTSTGVTIPTSAAATNAGIYVNGDVDNMKLSVSPTDATEQIIETWQTDSSGNQIYTKITMSAAMSQTTMQTTTTPPSGTPVTSPIRSYTGTTNGVVYVNGNVGSQGDPKTGGLYGVVADNVVNGAGVITHSNSLTVATNSSDNLNLAGNVTYHTGRAKDANGNYLPESQDSNFTTNAGVFGIISNTILLDTTDYNGNPLNTFEFDGSELAYNIVDADHWWDRSVGAWENMGSYLSGVVGVFGQFDGNNDLVTGFNTQFNYDARLRDTPPPYYPTTGNQYDIISWQRVASTLQ